MTTLNFSLPPVLKQSPYAPSMPALCDIYCFVLGLGFALASNASIWPFNLAASSRA